MKKSLILSAFAAVAISASAQMVGITPQPVRPSTAAGSTPMYPVLVDGEGHEYIAGNGDYLNFISVGAQDDNSWINYTVDQVKESSTVEIPANTIQIAGITHEYHSLFGYEWETNNEVTGEVVTPMTYSFDYYNYLLTESSEGLSYYPGKVQWISASGSKISEGYIYLSRQHEDGSYVLWEAECGPSGQPNITDFPTTYPIRMKFIGEDEYQFYNLVAEAMEFVEATGYRGGHFWDLKEACETEGVKWAQQAATVTSLLDLFKTEVFALNVNIEDGNGYNNMFGTKNFMFTSDIDGVRELVIKCQPEDFITVSFEGEDANAFRTQDERVMRMGVNAIDAINENGEVIIPIEFVVPEENKYILDNHVYTAKVVVNINNATSTLYDPNNRMNKSFSLDINGVNPGMSFNSDVKQLEKWYGNDISGCGQTIEVPFYTAGYGITQVENATSAYFREDSRISAPVATIVQEGFDEIASVSVERASGPRMEGLGNWVAKVTFKEGAPVGNYDFDVIVRDMYSDANTLSFHVRACESKINVVENGDIKFGAEGAYQDVIIEYINFNGCNKDKQIQCIQVDKAMPNPYVSVKFLDGNEDGSASDNLSGSGAIKARVTYAPAENMMTQYWAGKFAFAMMEWVENTETGYYDYVMNPCTTADLSVSYCVPGLDIQDNFDDDEDGDNKYVYTEHGQERAYDLYFQNVEEPYSVLDIQLTTSSDLWEIEDIRYTRDANNEDASQVHVTFIVKYLANDDLDHTGWITAKIGNIEYAKVIGLRGGKAKTPTAIETIETEVTAPAYNVAGQAVKNSAKGLVIKNGKKVVIK